MPPHSVSARTFGASCLAARGLAHMCPHGGWRRLHQAAVQDQPLRCPLVTWALGQNPMPDAATGKAATHTILTAHARLRLGSPCMLHDSPSLISDKDRELSPRTYRLVDSTCCLVYCSGSHVTPTSLSLHSELSISCRRDPRRASRRRGPARV